MNPRIDGRSLLLALVALVLGLAACVAIFVALDVDMIFLVGPAVGVALAAYAVYRTAQSDR